MAQRRKVLGIIALLLGSALIAVGTVLSLLYLFLPFVYHGQDVVAANVTLASAAALTLGLGVTLTYHARHSLQGKTSAVFFPPSPWLLTVLFALSLIVGQAMISLVPSPVLTALAFPPLHVVAAISPALALLAFAGRRTRAASWRTVSLELSHGGLLAPAVALAAEIVLLLIVVLIISFLVALTPGGLDRLMELSLRLQDPGWVEDSANVAELLLSPWALTAIVSIFVIIAPLIEEFLKGLGILLLALVAYRLPGRSEALLWGVACGAGFALGESLFNGSIALEGWGAVMIVRCGASLMHCVASGVMGLGWYQALVKRRPLGWLAAYGASAGIHALWNGAAIAVAVPSLLMLTKPDDILAQGVAGLIVIASLGFLLLLTASMSAVLFYLTRRVNRPPSEAPATDETKGFLADVD
jgi:RsiW-degrading membrane proteinase PrsW (M82 family)